MKLQENIGSTYRYMYLWVGFFSCKSLTKYLFVMSGDAEGFREEYVHKEAVEVDWI